MGWLEFVFCAFAPLSVGLAVSRLSFRQIPLLRSSSPSSSGQAIALGLAVLSAIFFAFQWGFLSISVCRSAWTLLSLASVVFLLLTARRKWSDWGALNVVVCLGVAALLTWVGAYLEFPGDPLSHLERIYRGSYGASLSYFWSHLALTALPYEAVRKLDVWQGIVGAMLCFQTLQLAGALGCNKRESACLALASLCLMGTGLFSYYRYYPLAEGFIAFCVYLGWLSHVVTISQEERLRWDSVALFLLCVLLTWHLHFQECVFVLLSTMTLAVPSQFRKRLAALLYGLTMLSVAWILVGHFYRVPGLLRPFVPALSVWQTLGIPGLLGLWASYRLSTGGASEPWKRLALVTLLLMFVGTFPISTYAIGRLSGQPYIAYRLLYGSVYWIALGGWVYQLVTLALRQNRAASLLVPAWTAVLLVALATPSASLFYGRLRHLTYRVPEELSPVVYLGAVSTVRRDCPSRDCEVLTDTLGRMALMAYSDLPFHGTRFHDSPTSEPLAVGMRQRWFIEDLQKEGIRYWMVRKKADFSPGWVGRQSGHWDSSVVLPRIQVHESYRNLIQSRPDLFQRIYEDAWVELFTIRQASVPTRDRK